MIKDKNSEEQTTKQPKKIINTFHTKNKTVDFNLNTIKLPIYWDKEEKISEKKEKETFSEYINKKNIIEKIFEKKNNESNKKIIINSNLMETSPCKIMNKHWKNFLNSNSKLNKINNELEEEDNFCKMSQTTKFNTVNYYSCKDESHIKKKFNSNHQPHKSLQINQSYKDKDFDTKFKINSFKDFNDIKTIKRESCESEKNIYFYGLKKN